MILEQLNNSIAVIIYFTESNLFYLLKPVSRAFF